jgi:Helix-turn-helix domain of resolvase
MNKLPSEKRAQVLQMMAEGISLRAITRLTGISRTTLLKLLEDAGQAFSEYQDRVLVNLHCWIYGWPGADTDTRPRWTMRHMHVIIMVSDVEFVDFCLMPSLAALVPTLFGGILRDFLALFWRERISARRAAF